MAAGRVRVSAAAAAGVWNCYDHLEGIPGSDLTVSDTGFQRDFRVYLQLRQTWLAFSYPWAERCAD